jgi:hypothetical protein
LRAAHSAPMRLAEYLDTFDQSRNGLAKRAGIQRDTIERLLEGHGCRLVAAHALVKATDGLVSYEDLLPPESDERKAG